VEYSSYPIVDGEENVGAVVAFSDISRRKQDETELREARARAEMFNDLLGHDINNMNQIGIGYLELVLETGRLDTESRALLEKPLEALRSSSRLIDNVRKLQDVKEHPGRLKPVDMASMLSEVKAHYAGVNGSDVSVSLAGSGKCRVKANDLLKDVFSNLVGNAIKHARGPVRVKVEADEVTMDDGTYCKVSVEDNGPGIPDDLKPRLFSRFQRGDTKAHGKGLGLYLVKTLVESYGGQVRVEDRVRGDSAQGARFVVLLPAAQ
jgi:signal transduction histidine kinase